MSEQQIEDLNAQDLPSALRRTPGVVISRHNPVGSFGGGEGGSIFIRGMGASRPGGEVQMLIDGVPKFVSIWTHPLMDVLSVVNIAQMNIYKGAQPVLFGNMAFAAVDISTKRMTEEGFHSSLEGAYGSFNTWIEVAEQAGKVSSFDYYLIQSFRKSDGHRDNADGELQNYFGRVGYQATENWHASLVFNHTDNWADDPGPMDKSIPPDGTFKTNDYFAVATLVNSFANTEGYIKLYSDNGHIRWVEQYNETTKKNDEDTLTDYSNFGLRARQTFKPWNGGEVLLGTDIDAIGGKVQIISPPNPDKYFNKQTWYLVSPYMAVSHMFGSKEGFYAIPSAGMRYFAHDEFGNEVGPQAGLKFGYRDTEGHIFCSRGVNYPGLFVAANDELFMPGDNRWRDLNPETVNHYELGLSHGITRYVKMDVTGFYDEGKNRIVVAVPPPFPPTWVNFGSYRTKGVEATLTVTPLDDLALFGGGTYLDATPSDLPYAPKWSASFGVNYRFFKDFQLSFDGLYLDDYFVGSRGRQTTSVNINKVDGYFLFNGKLTYDFHIPYESIKLKTQLFVAGENLTNVGYEQKYGYPMPGICGMGGLKLTF